MFKDSLWNVSDRVRWTPNQFQFWKCIHFWKYVFLLFHFKTSKYPNASKNIRMRPMWCLNFNFCCFKVSKKNPEKCHCQVLFMLTVLSTCSALGYFHTSTFGAHSRSFDGRVWFVYIKCFPNLCTHELCMSPVLKVGLGYGSCELHVSAALQQKFNSV